MLWLSSPQSLRLVGETNVGEGQVTRLICVWYLRIGRDKRRTRDGIEGSDWLISGVTSAVRDNLEVSQMPVEEGA